MNTFQSLLAATFILSMFASSAQAQDDTRAVTDPDEVLDPALSWVCLNPDTRRYEVVNAKSQEDAQQAVDGDDTTECKMIPAALDPDKVARELNEQ